MALEFPKMDHYFIGKVIKTALGTIFVILGSGILHYFGLLTVTSFIVVAVLLVIYGTFFDHKLTKWLEEMFDEND